MSLLLVTEEYRFSGNFLISGNIKLDMVWPRISDLHHYSLDPFQFLLNFVTFAIHPTLAGLLLKASLFAMQPAHGIIPWIFSYPCQIFSCFDTAVVAACICPSQFIRNYKNMNNIIVEILNITPLKLPGQDLTLTLNINPEY